MNFLLGFRGRAMSAGLAMMGLATLAPSGFKGIDAFLQTPLGPAVGSIAFIAIGMSVEETGTLRRIRIGVALRLAGAALLALAAVWTAVSEPDDVRSLSGLGWTLFAIGAAGVAYAARVDAAVYVDPRSGQRIWLEELTGGAMRVAVKDGPTVVIPTSEIVAAAGAESLVGRGVFIKVKQRDRLGSESSALPWIARSADGDTFALTEHQAGMNAEVLIVKVIEAASSGRERGFR